MKVKSLSKLILRVVPACVLICAASSAMAGHYSHHAYKGDFKGAMPMPAAPQDPRWYLALTGVYTTSNFNPAYDANLGYAYDTISGAGNVFGLQAINASLDAQLKRVQAGYDFGGEIEGGYRIDDAAHYVSLVYSHLTTSDSGSLQGDGLALGTVVTDPTTAPSAGSGQTTIPGAGSSLGTLPGVGVSHAKFDININTVDLMLGKMAPMNTTGITYMGAGLRWMDFGNTTDYDYAVKNSFAAVPETSPAGPIPAHDVTTAVANTVKSTADVIGPRFVLNSGYNLMNTNFNLVAGVAGSLLVGNVSTKYYGDVLVTDTLATGLPTVHVNLNAKDSENNSQLVPEADGKLGLSYAENFNGNNNFMIEAGWKVTHYFQLKNDSGLGVTTTDDIGFNGPYVKVQVAVL